MLPIYFFNGQKYSSSEAIVDIRDRGLAYGDGLFETMRVVDGRIPLWLQHKARLLNGCEYLGIVLSPEQLEQHCTPVFDTIKGLAETCVVKLMVTRGVSTRGYAPVVDAPPNLMSIINPLPVTDLDKKGCAIHQCREALPEPVSWAGLKTLNQLSYVLASAERKGTAFDEGLMLSSQGHIIEATARNLFCIRDNILYTPDLTYSGVAGVMRAMIINYFAPMLGIDVNISHLTPTDLLAADEVFLCNSVTGLWPVIRYADDSGDHDWPIGNTTVKLQGLIENFLCNAQ